MSSFDYQIQCEELTRTEPTAEDWAEYGAWLDSQESYEWSDEAIEFEESLRWDSLYEEDSPLNDPAPWDGWQDYVPEEEEELDYSDYLYELQENLEF
jgi:hypothetical protein|tara:strand:+ start:191 stop:481 length:291 start_codon:yes stop_codon:yes gene_type:complete